jgi:hypothetical protein
MLLALAHARAGLGATALAYADEVRARFATRQEIAAMEIAFAQVIHAYAAFAAGDRERHASSYAEATRACAAIADRDDREVVERVFVLVPVP